MEKCEALSTKPEECRYSFFQHTACEFFPCHETAHPEDFNCLFCYCPLYALATGAAATSAMSATASRIAAPVSCPTGGKATAMSPGSSARSRSWPKRTAIRKNKQMKSPLPVGRAFVKQSMERIDTDTLHFSCQHTMQQGAAPWLSLWESCHRR